MEMGILVVIILLLGYAIATVGDMKVIIKSLQTHTKSMIKSCDKIIQSKMYNVKSKKNGGK
jgi:uncharacterized protein YabE (DUF348 family)|tara:strand:+ start:48 stop:230 length:183 start_codon:yes stop_codon:yes gene_type:complete